MKSEPKVFARSSRSIVEICARGTARRLEPFPRGVTVNETLPRCGREAARRLEPFPSLSAVPGTHVDRREPCAEEVACTGLERGGRGTAP